MKPLTIHFNGEKQEISTSKLCEFLTELQVDSKYLAIAINNQVIPSAEYSDTTLEENDYVEVIQPVCGG